MRTASPTTACRSFSTRRTCGASTYQSYEWLSRKYLIPLFGRKRLVRLNGADIRKGFQILKGTCQCCAQGKDQAR